MPMATSMDKEVIREAYEDVRSNLTDTEWAIFKFESTEIICAAKGMGFEEFQEQFADDERAFGYIRIQTGDEMSKRSKFLLVTWIGPEVGVMQRAKMSTDKSIIKEIISVRRSLDNLKSSEKAFSRRISLPSFRSSLALRWRFPTSKTSSSALAAQTTEPALERFKARANESLSHLMVTQILTLSPSSSSAF